LCGTFCHRLHSDRRGARVRDHRRLRDRRVSIAGGSGTVAGAVLGALSIAVLDTALPFLRINTFVLLAVIGAVILIDVAANARAERRSGGPMPARASGGEGGAS